MISLQYRLLFIHLTEHASCWSVDCSLTVLSPLGAQTPPPTPSGHRLLMAMTTQKYFTLRAGPAFCGSVNNGRSSNAMSFRPAPLTPLLYSHFFWYQQTERRNTIESIGEFLCSADIKCSYCFPPFSQLGPPKSLLRNDGFSPLILHCSS